MEMEDVQVSKSLAPIKGPFALLHARFIRTPLFLNYLHAINQELTVDIDITKIRKNISDEQRKSFEELCRARLYLIAGSPVVLLMLFCVFFNAIGVQVKWQQSILFILGFTWGMIIKDMILWISNGRLMWLFNLLTLYLFITFLAPFLTILVEGILNDYPYSRITFETWNFLRQSLPILRPLSIEGILTAAGVQHLIFSVGYGIAVGLCSDVGIIAGLATGMLIILTGGTYSSIEFWIVFGFLSLVIAITVTIIATMFLEERRSEVTKSLAQLLAFAFGVGIAGSLTAGFYNSVVYAIVWSGTMGLISGCIWFVGEELPSIYRRVLAWGLPLSMVTVIAGFVALSVVAHSSSFVLFGLQMSLPRSVAFCGSWIIAYGISYTRLPLYLLWEVPVSWCISLCAALSPNRARALWRWQPITYDEYAMFPILGTGRHLVILSQHNYQGCLQAIEDVRRCPRQHSLLANAMSDIVQRTVDRVADLEQIAEFSERTSWLPRQQMLVPDALLLERIRSISRIVKESLCCPSEQRRIGLLQLQHEGLRQIISELRAAPSTQLRGLARSLGRWLDILNRERLTPGR